MNSAFPAAEFTYEGWEGRPAAGGPRVGTPSNVSFGTGVCRWKRRKEETVNPANVPSPVRVSHPDLELPHLPANPLFSGNIFHTSSLFSSLIPDSEPTLSVNPLRSISWSSKAGWLFWALSDILSITTWSWNCLSSIWCLNLHLSLSQEPCSHLNFTPSLSPQGPKIFGVRTHVLFITVSLSSIAHCLAYRRWSENIWWINNQMEQWQEGQGIYFSDFLRKKSLLDRDHPVRKKIPLEYKSPPLWWFPTSRLQTSFCNCLTDQNIPLKWPEYKTHGCLKRRIS